MSRQSLIRFLTKLDKELYGSSSQYRKEADGREMSFTFNANRFVEALKKEFEFRKLSKEFNSQDIQNFMYKGAGNILTACANNAKSFKQTRGVIIRRNQYSLKVIIATETNPRTDKNYNNFDKLKKLYKTELDSFVLSLNEYLKANYGKKLNKVNKRFDQKTYENYLEETNTEIQFGSDLIEGGHEEGQGILESRVADAIDTAINEKYTRQILKDNVANNFEALGIDIGFVRDDKTDSHAIFAQSRVENQTTGFMSGREKSEFRKQLKMAIEKLQSKEPIQGIKGSDSIEEFKVKQVNYSVMTELGKAKSKNVKVTKVKKPKATKRNATSSQKRKSGRVVNSALPLAAVKKGGGRKSGTSATRGGGSAISLLRFIELINRQLPDTVAKNMGRPGLEYRTGRFASSVRVTEVVPTTKGFPSVGYTYMKNPYQTFEPGFRQGSVDRDPRRVIDRSIREIAAQLVTVRLYTRRV